MSDDIKDSAVAAPAVEVKDKEKDIILDKTSTDVQGVEIAPGYVAEKDFEGHYQDVPIGEGIVPDDDDEFIDPRLKDYAIPLVAKTVDLRNDPT